MHAIDLSFPIDNHFRWQRTLEHTAAFERGDIFQTSAVRMSCHAFTHVDAPVHFRRDGADITEVPLDTWTGAATVVDLSDVDPEAEITAERLQQRASAAPLHAIVLLKTCWDSRVGVDSPDYWATAPYVAREAAEWLHARGVGCVGFDFPQDWGIRALVRGEEPEPADFVTHDVLLANGVGLVEYLAGLDQVHGDRTFFVAAPLRMVDADGSPVRAMAFEDLYTEGR